MKEDFSRELELVPQELREQEAELMQMRWFDYQRLLPGQATKVFADTYAQVYREFYGQTRDYRTTEESIDDIPDSIFDSEDLLAFWQARQAADRIGCKYDFYLRAAFKRSWGNAWKFLPRPNQLYNYLVVRDVAQEWEDYLDQVTPMAECDFFKGDAYIGSPEQDAYRAYLLKQVRRRERSYMLLSRLVFKDRILPADLALREFGADALARAKAFFENQ